VALSSRSAPARPFVVFSVTSKRDQPMTRTYSNMTRLRWLELDRSDNNAGGRCRRGPSLFGGPQDVFDDGHGVRASNTGRMRPQPPLLARASLGKPCALYGRVAGGVISHTS